MKSYRVLWTLFSMSFALVAGLTHMGSAASPSSKFIEADSQPVKIHPFARPKFDKTAPEPTQKYEATSYAPAYGYEVPETAYEDTGDQTVIADSLDLFVHDAYLNHNNAEFAGRIGLHARVASSILSASDHHHRVLERIQPEFPGHFLSILEPTPHLEYFEAPFFEESQPYSPDAPLKQFVIIEVSGEIDFQPLDYEAFLFKFVSPEGFCQIKLMDPVFPGVSSFVDDALLSQTFPDCEGPQAARERFILEASPELVITGRDEGTGAILVSHTTAAGHATPSPGSVARPSAGKRDGCDDYRVRVSYGWDSSEICSDLWWGYGNWVRGGSYWQNVICSLDGDDCSVQTVNSGDDLHSSIRPAGWGSCQCCDNYGASVSGKTASAYLLSDNGTSGGHVAIAKTLMAWRTSTTQSVSSIGLDGQCGGDLDLPHHGSKVSAGGSLDYNVTESVQQNKAQVGGWNAENIASHLCKPRRTKLRRKPGRVVPQWR